MFFSCIANNSSGLKRFTQIPEGILSLVIVFWKRNFSCLETKSSLAAVILIPAVSNIKEH